MSTLTACIKAADTDGLDPPRGSDAESWCIPLSGPGSYRWHQYYMSAPERFAMEDGAMYVSNTQMVFTYVHEGREVRVRYRIE